MKWFKIGYVVLFGLLAQACGLGSGSNDFTNPKAFAVDTTNGRLFIFESNQEVLVREASSNDNLGDQPVINEDDTETLFDAVPDLVTQAVAYANGSDTRVFVFGGVSVSNGGTVTNQIQVFNYSDDGFSIASFSPITLSDGNDSTSETDHSFPKALLDDDNAQIFIADATDDVIYVIDADDGTEVTAAIAVANTPVDLALDGDSLYVCHSDGNNISIIDVLDYSVATFELGFPCQSLDVLSNDSKTLLAVRQNDDEAVHLLDLNTVDFTFTDVTTNESDLTDGRLLSGAGISSIITDILLTKNSSDEFIGYFPEQDGNVEVLTFDADLSNFTFERISTSALNYLESVDYRNANDVSQRVYILAETGFLLSLDFDSDGNLDSDLDS